MNIDELKSGWQQAGGAFYSEKELAMMTRVRNHPTLKKLRIKMLSEIVMLGVLLFVYYDGFDGADKPFYVNTLLVISICLFILNNAVGYFRIQNPIVAGNIRDSLTRHTRALQHMAILSLITSASYAVSLLLFFTSKIVFDQHKYIILSALIVASMLLFYYSWISWQRKIRHFRQLEADF